MALVRGDAFWLAGTGSDTNPGSRHLFVSLGSKTDARGFTEHLVIPICSKTSRSDTTCEVGSKDHPSLKHASYAAFYQARTISQKTIDVAQLGNEIKGAQPASEALIAKIEKGLLVSEETTPLIKAFYASLTKAAKPGSAV